MYELIVNRKNWRDAGGLAEKMFAPGWLHYEHVSHYFKEGNQFPLCASVIRNGETPDEGPSWAVCLHCKQKLISK